MTLQFLDQYDGILPNLPKSYGRICCICGRDITYYRGSTPVWYRYKDDNGSYTGEWTCHNCNGKRKKQKYNKFRCRICGSEKTRIQSNGKSLWIKDKNIKKEYTGHLICYDCYYQKNKICFKCNKSNIKQLFKHYDNHGNWSGRFLCYNCLIGIDQLDCSICGKDIKISYYEEFENDISTGRIICDECLSESEEYKNKYIGNHIGEFIVAKFLDIGQCFINGHFKRNIFGLYRHNDFGIISVKEAAINRGGWTFNINGKSEKNCDFFLCIGYNANKTNIESVYIIPNENHLENKIYIDISDTKFAFFKEDPKPWNSLFHSLTSLGLDSRKILKKFIKYKNTYIACEYI